MSVEQITTARYKCTCEATDKDGVVCGYKWESDSIPDRCARCKKPTWNRSAIRVGRNGKQIVAFGRSQTRHQWGKEFGISPETITARIRHGWAIEDAVTKPAHRRQI